MSLRTHMEDIYARRGELTPAIVVEEATPAGSPLHDRFEWDDTEAAHQYRLVQARELLRVVKIRYENAEGEKVSLRWAHALPNEDQSQTYIPTDEILGDPMLRKLLINQMLRDIEALQRRYEHLDEYWDWLKRQRRRRKAS